MTGSTSDRTGDRLAYSVDEAAAITGLSRDLLYDQMRAGRLAYLKVGRRRIITASTWKPSSPTRPHELRPATCRKSGTSQVPGAATSLTGLAMAAAAGGGDGTGFSWRQSRFCPAQGSPSQAGVALGRRGPTVAMTASRRP
jgi:excisionase family DNA binding protein